MNYFFMVVYFATILSLETLFLILAVCKKNKKYFKITNGLVLGLFISIFMYYIYYTSDIYSYDTGAWVGLGELINSIFFFIVNLIIGTISLFFKMFYKKKNLLIDNSKKGITIIFTLIISIISFIIIYGQFVIKNNEKQRIDNEVKEETMIYLKEKYGSDDFEIVDIDRNFSENGFIGTDYLENYDIDVIYVPDNIKFNILLDVDDSRKILRDSSRDLLILKYYEKYFNENELTTIINNERNKLNNFLKSHQMNVRIYGANASLIAYDGVPNDYGKIPSKEKLYNYILNRSIKHLTTLKIEKDEIKGENVELELKEYLIKLSRYIIDYYTVLDDYEIKISYSDKNYKLYDGTISIDNGYININVESINEKIKI